MLLTDNELHQRSKEQLNYNIDDYKRIDDFYRNVDMRDIDIENN